MDTTRFDLAHATNTALLATLRSLVGHGNEITADVLAHLAELDARKLYLEQGFASLFAYAVTALGFSEGSAYKRVYAARAARRFPVIFDLVQKGEIHLSAVTLLAPHLTTENHRELLGAAAHQSKRDLALLVAARFPAPDAPTLLRRLPRPIPTAPLVAPRSTTTLQQQAGAAAAASPTTTAPTQLTPQCAHPAPATVVTRANKPGPANTLTPLSADRHRLQLTLSQNGCDALRRAQELLGSRVPNGDLAIVCELALTEFVAKLERRKFAKAKRPRHPDRPRGRATTKETSSHEPKAPPSQSSSIPPASPPQEPQALRQRRSRSRYIPAAVKRAVAERDGYQCSFVAPNGQRCQKRRDLHYHHEEVFARGGPSSVENLRIMCAEHNRYYATVDFGASWIDGVIATKRSLSSTCPSNTTGESPRVAARAPGIVAKAPKPPSKCPKSRSNVGASGPSPR